MMSKSDGVKVMSFNIRYGTADDGANSWRFRRNSTLKMLAESGCTLIGLQEVLHEQLLEFCQIDNRFQWIGVGRDDGISQGEFSAILYDATQVQVLESETFWFSETPHVVGSTDWGNSLTRICTRGLFQIGGAVVEHYNLHIDHESGPSRLKSIQYLCHRMKDSRFQGPKIITGDFNAGESSEPIRWMSAKGFVDSYRSVFPLEPESATYHGWTGTLEGDKIDYVFVSSNIEILEAEIVRQKVGDYFVSDHYPVTATLKFPIQP